MIKIKRLDCPESLNKPAQSFGKSDYKNDDVKERLLEMQHQKCCYCEVKFYDLGYKEIEHYIPQSADCFKDENGNPRAHLVHAWSNLLYACKNCNLAKLDKNPINQETSFPIIINPTDNNFDPEDHIGFITDEGFMAHDSDGKTPLGISTCKLLKFNERTEFFGWFKKVRMEVDGCIMDLVHALINDDIPIVEIKKKELTRMMCATSAFAAFHRTLISKRIEQLNKQTIPILIGKYEKQFNEITIDFPKGAERVNI